MILVINDFGAYAEQATVPREEIGPDLVSVMADGGYDVSVFHDRNDKNIAGKSVYRYRLSSIRYQGELLESEADWTLFRMTLEGIMDGHGITYELQD
jgi:hypothetical protein